PDPQRDRVRTEAVRAVPLVRVPRRLSREPRAARGSACVCAAPHAATVRGAGTASPDVLACTGMSLRIERIPTLRANYTYLLVCEASGEAAVVDAPEEASVVARADALGVRIAKVLSTHHHPDHSMANPALAKRYDAPVYGHRSDEGRLPGQTHGLEEGDTVSVGR